MRKILFLLIFVMFFALFTRSQIYRDTSIPSVLNGVIHEKGTYNPVSGAKVAVKGTNIEIYADGQGFFVIPHVKGMKGGDTWLQISAEDFETLEMPITIGGIEELGIILMTPKYHDLNPITVNDLRAAGSDAGKQSFSEPGTAALLFGTNDVLVNAANYNLGTLGLRLHGYEWKNIDVYFNGVPMNEAETGYANPMLWNGLNDAMDKAEGSYGLNSSLLYYGNIGGVSNMRIRPSEFRKRFKASYGFNNSLYNHRLMLTYATGRMKNGWSFLLSASGRLGSGFVKGTKFESLSYLLVAEKEIDVDQSLMLTVLGAPTRRGMQNYSTQEVYDIADNNYYNSAWGDDNGKKRNSRVNSYHLPLISLSHNWDINDWTLFRTTLGFTFGKSSETSLLWNAMAKDPRPDTYDKLPNPFSDPVKQQINWADIYETNQVIYGGSTNPRYILGAQHADRWATSLNSIYDNEISETLVTTVGIQARMTKGSYYNHADDLLGADYWLDIDKFAEGYILPGYEQNDLNHPYREIKAGDRFVYDYNISQVDFNMWNRWIMSWRNWDFMASVSASYTSFWREGNMKNGKFPDNSLGKSNNQNFFNYAAKGSVAYPLFNGRIEGFGTYMTRAPQFRDAYLLPQISDIPINNLESETIWGAELNYLMPGAFFSVRLSGFYTQFSKQTRTRFYYDDDYQSLFSMSLTGLAQRHCGGELSAEVRLIPQLTLKVAALYGNYKYTSDPTAILMRQNTAQIVYNDTVQMNGVYVAGTPQMAFMAGVLYDSPKKWWLGANINFAGNNYVEVNPICFIDEIITHEQEKLKSAFTLDAYGGYTFEFGKKYLGINLNAHNLLGTKSCIGAYEPLTVFDTNNQTGKHATSYAYTYGRTIFLIVSFRF
jgi:hypothetical protein